MKKSILLILAVFILPTLVAGAADITKADIDKLINKSGLKHPYLYFNDFDKPAILERIKNDPESRDIMNRLLARANMLLHMPVEKEIPVQGRNTRAGWTEYDKTCLYDTFDLTDLLRPGKNGLRVMLGNGWYKGRYGLQFEAVTPQTYGDEFALIGELRICLASGEELVVGTDDSWQAVPAPVLESSI